MIYICDKCLRACCWAGIFMCDESRNAGIYRAHKRDLIRFSREHSDYMEREEVQAPRHDKATPLMPRSLVRKVIAELEAAAEVDKSHD